MNLYLDDDTVAHRLIGLLQRAGHVVTLPGNVGLSGAKDPRHFVYAISQGRVLLTRNHDDFLDLHLVVQAAGGSHAGVLAVRYDNDPRKDMKPPEVVRAIAKLEASGLAVVNQFHILNHWP